jgi:hypothetical protein
MRFAYWTIVIDGQATAFRALTPEDLLPTLNQLRKKTPGATLKWYHRGRLWDSPEAARGAERPPLRRTAAPAGRFERRPRDPRGPRGPRGPGRGGPGRGGGGPSRRK